MKAKNIAYWIITGLVALALATGGAMNAKGGPEVAAGMAHLGYPAYFATIIGVWKLLAVAALLVPGFPRLKEWAYAGVVVNLTGAAISHLAVGDGMGKAFAPLMICALAFVSWALRPQSRVLGSVGLPGAKAEGHSDHAKTATA